MRISISQDNVNFKPVAINNLNEFINYAKTYNYSTGIFKDNYRNKANFVEAECIALDVDNDGPSDFYTIEDAAKVFKDYKHIIMPSKSHQKEKNGKIADRFRIILFLNDTITDSKDFTATWLDLLKFYPGADRACKDASRFYYPSPQSYSVNENGKTWPISKYVEPEKNELDAYITNGEKGQLSKQTLNFLAYGAPAGKRNKRLFKAAKDMQEQGFSIEECKIRITAMIDLTKNWGTPHLNKTDIMTIENAYKNIPMYEPREGEVSSPSVFKFQTVKEMVQEAGNVEWLVDGMLSVGGFSVIAGPPKKGKSTIVRQLIKTICQGGTFLEREVKKGSVVYLSFEEQPAILKEQFDAIGINENDPIMIHVGAVFDDRALSDLEQALYEFCPDLVVIDTLFDISQLEDINSYKAVKDALARIRDIARKTNTHILGVHHTNKTGQFMGSQAIYGAVDTMMSFHAFKDRRYLTTSGKHGAFFDDQELIYNAANMHYTLGDAKTKRDDLL